MSDGVEESCLLHALRTDQIEVGVEGIMGTLHIPNGYELIIRVLDGEAKVFHNKLATQDKRGS